MSTMGLKQNPRRWSNSIRFPPVPYPRWPAISHGGTPVPVCLRALGMEEMTEEYQYLTLVRPASTVGVEAC
jgi:hypothetical protein